MDWPTAIEVESLVEKAEKAVQKILIDLTNETGIKIDIVRVDTRNFASLQTEILLADTQR